MSNRYLKHIREQQARARQQARAEQQQQEQQQGTVDDSASSRTWLPLKRTRRPWK